MKKIKRIAIIVLALMLVCTLFVACNDKNNADVNGEQPTQKVERKPWAQPDPNNELDLLELSQRGDYSNAEIKGKEIYLTLTNSESLNNLFYDYTPTDFGEDRFCSVINKFPERLNRLRNQIENGKYYNINDATTEDPTTYTRTLTLELVNQGRESALECIEYLYSKEYVRRVEPDGKNKLTWFTTNSNDSGITQQWGLEKIKAYDAWDIATGSTGITVGLIDSGIKQTHEDLTDNVSELSCGTAPYMDDVNHGTRTAGIIGAVGNNGKGISGVCWNVKIASLKACVGNTDETPQLVIAAIQYAKENNIKLSNFSGGFYQNDINGYTDELRAIISSYNGLIVVAAGNGEDENGNPAPGTDNGVKMIYPQSYGLSNVISVGATDSNDNKASFSNYGATTVDLFAPGTNIYTTSASTNTSYGTVSGTSLAAPFVTGVAALIWSVEPNLTAAQVKSRIMQNVDPIPALSNMCVSGGRLNAQKALEAHGHNRITCTYTNKTIRSGHYVNCKYCDHSTLEAHTWDAVNVPGTTVVKHYLCRFCGAMTDIIAIPNPYRFFTSNALTLMLEKEQTTSGDYTIEITRDIVLVKKNGKYYLMVACDDKGNILADLSKVLKK